MRIFNQSAAAWLAAMFVAALCAGAMTLTGADIAAKPPAANTSTAGLGKMQLLDDEHALVARALAEQNDRQRTQALAADLALTQEKSRAVALADEGPSLQLTEMRPAVSTRSGPKHSLPVRRSAAKLASGLDMQPVENPAGPPLSLHAALATSEMVTTQQSRNGLLRRVRDVVETVERVPGWVNDAADWIVELPAQAIPRRLRAARLNVML